MVIYPTHNMVKLILHPYYEWDIFYPTWLKLMPPISTYHQARNI